MALILAIESSCDETAVALVRGEPGRAATVLASVVASQIELHRQFGGVVPELASRNHSLHLHALVEQALRQAAVRVGDVDAFAATTGPGLASSLLIGSTAAKALACASRRPFLGINHLEGHLLSPFVGATLVPPHVALIVSGGHTLVSESGIHTRRDVQMLEDGGVDAILVGESILTSGNIRGKIQELLGHDQD